MCGSGFLPMSERDFCEGVSFTCRPAHDFLSHPSFHLPTPLCIHLPTAARTHPCTNSTAQLIFFWSFMHPSTMPHSPCNHHLPSTHPTHPPTHSPSYALTHTSNTHPPIYSTIHRHPPSTDLLSIQLSIHLPVHPFTLSSTHPSIH